MGKHSIVINKNIPSNSWFLVTINEPFIGLDRFTRLSILGNGAKGLVTQYRFSKDGINFSEWIEWPNWTLSNDSVSTWFNFRIKSDTGFNLSSLDLEWEVGSFVEGPCEFSCRVYDENSFIQNCGINQQEYNTGFGGVAIWEEMSLSIFQRFGWPIVYFKVNGIKQSKDFVFNEYSLLEVSDCKKMQIVIPDNDFGRGDYQFTEYDIDFSEDLEFQISKEMFWSAFGHLETPAEKDFIYFPIENKMFRVNSIQESRDYMRQSFWWKGTLVKWNDSDSIYKSDKIEETLEQVILNYSNTEFEQLNEEEGIDVTVPNQYEVRNISESDSVRSEVDLEWEENGIVRENLTNYFTIFSKYQYNLKVQEPRRVIKYKSAINLDESFSLMFWYKGVPRVDSDLLKLFGGNLEISTSGTQTIQTVDIFGNTFTPNVPLDEWYAWYIGYNKTDNTLTLRIFRRQDNKKTIKMEIFYENTCRFSGLTGKWVPELWGSNGFITSIRFLKGTVKLEDLSKLFTQLVFKDSSKAYLVDECWKIINYEKFSSR